MKYRIVFKPTALKDLKKLPKTLRRRMKEKLEFYLSQTEPLDYAVQLVGNKKSGEYRFRIGDYRIVFDKQENTLVILYIEHRRNVYRKR
jgi:mRNA interferase RelE/StbE